jgi:DMSO/TMAO reductase YedYZ molybdopterin-dependent catalytic subunit
MREDEAAYFEDRRERLEHRLRAEYGLSRRGLLALAVAGAPILAGARRLAWPAAARAAGPIVKPLPAEWFIPFGSNAEMRWDAAAGLGYAIPNERFFVRNHTFTPTIDAATWRLTVAGSGLTEPAGHQFSLRSLRRLPAKTVTAFIECAGNGRSFFGSQQGTPAAGTQWTLGGVGVARWRGVPLSVVLERAGITKAAFDVMPEGLDPEVAGQGHVRRPLPVSKALDDVLLAYEMNGEPLPPDHGAPVRLIVPGWVGVANIKWLGRIEVADRPLYSPWNTTQYRLAGPSYPADAPPLTQQAVKSAFEFPRGVQLQAGRTHTLTGRSWSGRGTIRGVEVSTDAGRSFRRAELHGPNLPNAWVRWSLPFTPTRAGTRELRARATDSTGRRQPDNVPFNTGGYLFWALVKHPVTVIA